MSVLSFRTYEDLDQTLSGKDLYEKVSWMDLYKEISRGETCHPKHIEEFFLRITQVLKTIHPKITNVLLKRYSGETYAMIGTDIGLSRERARQMVAKGIKILQHSKIRHYLCGNRNRLEVRG